jgi:hypothetical protein
MLSEGKPPKLSTPEFATENQIELITSLTDTNPEKRPTMDIVISKLKEWVEQENANVKPVGESKQQKAEDGYLVASAEKKNRKAEEEHAYLVTDIKTDVKVDVKTDVKIAATMMPSEGYLQSPKEI